MSSSRMRQADDDIYTFELPSSLLGCSGLGDSQAIKTYTYESVEANILKSTNTWVKENYDYGNRYT